VLYEQLFPRSIFTDAAKEIQSLRFEQELIPSTIDLSNRQPGYYGEGSVDVRLPGREVKMMYSPPSTNLRQWMAEGHMFRRLVTAKPNTSDGKSRSHQQNWNVPSSSLSKSSSFVNSFSTCTSNKQKTTKKSTYRTSTTPRQNYYSRVRTMSSRRPLPFHPER
jgi:hypothetical protein